MHNKFIIFDNHTVFTGSMNFSPAGLSGYDVNDVVIINSDDISRLYTEELQIINSAKKNIYAPTYLITHKDIANALISAHNKGIDVKIILDANSATTQNSKHKLLRDSNVKIKFENYAGKLHSKALIIDESYVILGSMNFSNSGENKNDENTVIIQNYKLASSYKNFFNYLWSVIPYLKFNPSAESKASIGSCTDGVDNNFNGKIDTEEDACK